MPLNKLENFIKNTEGRILYVNPNDLDATDGIENQGNSLTKPFKTVQRALIESARFSYLRGNDNDITEKTTILLFPGEHLIDNRPGFAIYDAGGVARAVSPGGTESAAQNTLTLTLDSNFDLTQSDNILYKFNSVNGGVIVPRGTSIVGLDLRKTKLRPKYVPNPTDSATPSSAIFRITGACYFWQFSLFDADENTLVYTDPQSFSTLNQSKPTFSHHKLTCFEYADGVNNVSGYSLTDLDMYYSKVGNAFNRASGRDIDQKYPENADSFAKLRPEWEIVGAFQPDPINVSNIISGDGATPGQIVTVSTTVAHELSAGTPIKIRGVNVNDYNISTKVQTVVNDTTFTYLLPLVRDNLPAGPAGGLSGGSATVTIETDTVSGASPYVFNISLRSVWGMQGMHADGSKASGFRSMVVAQFTAVSLQKDDRAFVKYNKSSRSYTGIGISKVTGARLASESSSTNQATVYHLDPDAVYRTGWKTTHIKVSNDSFIQIVSVFAIGFHKHFEVKSGGDASITNSNSNFGQHSLAADGFRKEAFDKDDRGYITSIVTPRSIVSQDSQIEWLQFDVNKTRTVAKNNHLYLLGYTSRDILPPVVSQGYRVGAKINETLYVDGYSATVLMTDDEITISNPTASGTKTSEKNYNATIASSIYTLSPNHTLKNGETIRVISESGDYPENIEPNTVYYAITSEKNATRSDGITLASNQIQIASSKTNASAVTPIYITSYLGTELKVISRVSDKDAGDLGHPIQWDPVNNQWFIHTSAGSSLYTYIIGLSTAETEISYFIRKEDGRSLDERLYKVRYVIPKELENGREPGDGFVLQDSQSTNVRTTSDFTATAITNADYDFNRNPRFITTCTYNAGPPASITVLTDKPHTLKVNDQIVIKNVTSSTNTPGTVNRGYNGTFTVVSVVNDKTFTYSPTDIYGVVHDVGTFTNNTNVRTTALPRFERSDAQKNLYVYRKEVISPYIYNVQDGVYYLYLLNASNAIETEFTDLKYSQNLVDLYPQQDKDNYNDNPSAAKTYAKRSPIGDVVTNDLKKSITRETIDKFYKTFDYGLEISSVSDSGTSATLSLTREHQLSGIKEYTTLNGGSGHTNGTYYNVKLFNDASSPTSAVWDGATATVVVSGGSVSSATITEGGSGYVTGETLYFDSSKIGGTPNANIVVTNAGISTTADNYVQITGIGTTAGGYFRVSSTSNKSAISIAKTTGDPTSVVGQYVIPLGPISIISQDSYDSTSGIATFSAISGSYHGLLAGSSFRILDSSNNNLGDFVVGTSSSVRTFTAKTEKSVSGAYYLLKHGMSANSASADKLGENLGTRGLIIYDNETMVLNEEITTDSSFKVKLRNSSGIGTTRRFPLGSYIQIDNEIMRITSSTLSGASNDEISVIRGSMGTIIENHSSGVPIRKIKLAPVQFHRPAILRASGHTFEYLGYGPGNYSTGLPQVQLKTLSEREDFLAQAQETACGSVIYTGMNSNGDVFSGNTKTSAASGTVVSYDIPKPTVTGQDPNRLSVVFDEVIVKERILVEGGNSSQLLSQFDGPVTFNSDVRMNNQLILNDDLRVNGQVDIRNTTESVSCETGALIIAGGTGIQKRLNVCGDVKFTSSTGSASTTTGALVVSGGVGIGSELRVGGGTTLGGNLRVAGVSTFTGFIDANDGAYIDNIQIGIAGDNEIDTTSGNLTIDSAGGTTTIDDNLIVGGTSTLNGNVAITGALTVTGDITAFYTSDQRLKDNVSRIEDPLSKVLSISGNTYVWNQNSGKEGNDVGVIAQEIAEVLPEAVTTRDNGYLAVDYQKIIPLLVEAVKELSQKVSDLEDKLNK